MTNIRVDFDSPSKNQSSEDNNMQVRIESSGDIRITESGNHQDELNVTIHDMEFGRRNVGIWGTAFNIFKCFIGIGLLALPSAFHNVNEHSLYNYSSI